MDSDYYPAEVEMRRVAAKMMDGLAHRHVDHGREDRNAPGHRIYRATRERGVRMYNVSRQGCGTEDWMDDSDTLMGVDPLGCATSSAATQEHV